MKTTILSFFALFFFACGSGGETNSGSDPKTESAPTSANACESAGTKICARACACATDGKCRIGVATDAGTASINFDDEQACLDLYVALGCSGGGEAGFDYARCDSAVDDAACVDTAGGRGVLMPAECNVNRK
jgi:hypothetical protein